MTLACSTRNPGWGFYGSIKGFAAADEAWATALREIATATACDEEAVRDFLDSRHDRHFADDVTSALRLGSDLKTALKQAIDRWMTWRIGGRTSRSTGIPADLPYLTGFVLQSEIEAESASDRAVVA